LEDMADQGTTISESDVGARLVRVEVAIGT
jgi:hypothetical protein